MRTIARMESTGDWPVTEYCGCGKCMVGAIRLSKMTDKTHSPERQMETIAAVTAAFGGHIIGWAKDLEVSGATNPLTRPELGPWLRDEMGLYSGIVGSAVDRIGRNARDVLNTAWMIHESGRTILTHGHEGPWDLDDTNDENAFTIAAFGAQIELRAIQKRNREDTVKARNDGRKKNQNAYGYRFVRKSPTAGVDHVEVDPVAAEILRDIADRILSAENFEVTCFTEAARLNRAGILSPSDYRAVMYGREPKGTRWTGGAVRDMLISDAALGYLVHEGRAVIGKDGHPVQLAEPLWDRTTQAGLIAKTAPRSTFANARAPKGKRLLSGRVTCGICGARAYLSGRPIQWVCTARVRGIATSQHCKPAPGMIVSKLDEIVEEYFLTQFGPTPLVKQVFDPGSGHGPRIAQLEADRKRLREDRAAGLYDSADDAAWFREVYARIGQELDELLKIPVREAALRWVRTGETVADEWHKATSTERREMLTRYGVKAVIYPRGHRPRV
jgi:site-specific DNA recombinase